MKIRQLGFLTAIGFVMTLLSSCDAIIEPSISKRQVQLEAPADQYMSTSYTLNFWWDEVSNALSYRLQVVTPNFAAPGNLVLDTVVTRNRFAFNFNPGNYQWRVLAQNGSSQTAFTPPRNFTVVASSIKQQTVQLTSPANNYITNQSNIFFQWSSLYGATQYRFEIDTNNFANPNTVISNLAIPGQQINFTFPKDQVYQWRVRAENDTAQAQWSAVYTVTYDHTPPGKVNLVAPANGQTVPLPVSLQWGTSISATRYKLYVFKSDSTSLYNQNFPLQVNAASYSFNLGKSGDKVYWKVTALDAAGNESLPSDLRNFVLQ
ncbi:MAG: hypothetical protein JWR02_3026 [Mucilaginibacter sp.]|nr:hypothetical protein [Mucilaginibacter sp.]